MVIRVDLHRLIVFVRYIGMYADYFSSKLFISISFYLILKVGPIGREKKAKNERENTLHSQ